MTQQPDGGPPKTLNECTSTDQIGLDDDGDAELFSGGNDPEDGEDGMLMEVVSESDFEREMTNEEEAEGYGLQSNDFDHAELGDQILTNKRGSMQIFCKQSQE